MPKSLTSDNDYLKLTHEGSALVNVTATSVSNDHPNAVYSAAFTINHSLGEVPFVRCWLDANKNGNWHDGNYDLVNGSNFWLTSTSTTTTTNIIVNSNASTTTNLPIYYKLYANGSNGFTSDEKYDKIFKKGSGSTNLAAAGAPPAVNYTSSTITVAHGGGEVPLFHVEFSEDGSNYYKAGSIIEGPPDTTSGPPGGPYFRYFITTCVVYADATNLYITPYHNYNSVRTIYVRYAAEYET